VNNRDRNLMRAKMERRQAQIEAAVARYLRRQRWTAPIKPTGGRDAKLVGLDVSQATHGDLRRRRGELWPRARANLPAHERGLRAGPGIEGSIRICLEDRTARA
jgi:hypothetical protein